MTQTPPPSGGYPWLDAVREHVLALHLRIRNAVTAACAQQALEELSAVAADEPGDTIYAIDKVSEELLVESFTELAQRIGPIVLIAEGLAHGKTVLPSRALEEAAVVRIIVDPIDGTRGIMYQKRPAWILTGVAPNRGNATDLQDLVLSVVTELPLLKQHLADQFWAVKNGPLHAVRHDLLRNTTTKFQPHPSRAPTIAHGCAYLSRFFPGARDELSAIEEDLMRQLLGPAPAGKALCFEDQCASSGGQMVELLMGRDRFMADLRPLMRPLLARRQQPTSLCCHPYDLAGLVVAEAAGVLVTDENGGPLRAPLDVDADVCWVGYANAALRQAVEPVLQRVLRERGWLA